MIPAATRFLPCILVLGFAAGCSSTTTVEVEEETAQESEASEAKTTKVAHLEVDPKAEEAECPNAPAPTCADGESLRMGVDGDGCLVPRCVVLCETKPAPTCKAGEVIRTSMDASGCTVSYCFTE